MAQLTVRDAGKTKAFQDKVRTLREELATLEMDVAELEGEHIAAVMDPEASSQPSSIEAGSEAGDEMIRRFNMGLMSAVNSSSSVLEEKTPRSNPVRRRSSQTNFSVVDRRRSLSPPRPDALPPQDMELGDLSYASDTSIWALAAKAKALLDGSRSATPALAEFVRTAAGWDACSAVVDS